MKKIFAVDDEWDLLFTIKKVVEYFNEDYKVKTLDSGKKLFQQLEKGIPDLILLDIMMPDMNGWEVLKKLKSTPEWSRIPIIFISSVVDDTSKRTARLSGDDYLEKPFTFDDLNQKIKNVLK
jgi:CheY-like chemotaxis protein